MSTLAHNIRELRKGAGLSQRELAEKVGVALITMHRIEAGQRVPDWTTVCRIADVFGVSMDDLRKANSAASVASA